MRRARRVRATRRLGRNRARLAAEGGRHGHRGQPTTAGPTTPPTCASHRPGPDAGRPPRVSPSRPRTDCVLWHTVPTWITTSSQRARCSRRSTTRARVRSIATMSPVAPRARRHPLPRGRPGRPALRHRRGQDQARPHLQRRPREPARRSSARARCSASCRCSTPARAPPRPPRSTETRLARPGPRATCKPWLSARPEVASTLLRGARPPAAPHQRGARRPGLHRRARPRGQGAARPRRAASAARPTTGIHVAHDLTQEELAQLVGASRETVNKALADFAQRGWLRLEARAVVLLDVERLKRRAR